MNEDKRDGEMKKKKEEEMRVELRMKNEKAKKMGIAGG